MKYLQPGESKNTLNSGAVYSIYIDKQSRKWIGTLRGGINIIDPQKERFHAIADEPRSPNSISGNFISAFYETPDSSLWVGTDGNGLNVLQRDKNSFSKSKKDITGLTGFANSFITSIRGDIDHNIWVATFTSGILRFNLSKRKVETYFTVNSRNGIENKVVYQLYILNGIPGIYGCRWKLVKERCGCRSQSPGK